jgi:hypothetical protein
MTRDVHTRQAVPPRRRRGRSLNSVAIQLSAFALTFIVIAVLVVTSSRAAFVAQNDNTANQVTSASIALGDNDSGASMFNLSNLLPAAPEERCIDVTYTGSANPMPVLLYATAAPTGTLAPYLDLVVEIGTDATPAFGDCTGFGASSTLYNGTLQGFWTAHGSYATGRATWDPAVTGEVRTFRFTVTVQNVAAAANKTSTFGFSWETRTS